MVLAKVRGGVGLPLAEPDPAPGEDLCKGPSGQAAYREKKRKPLCRDAEDRQLLAAA